MALTNGDAMKQASEAAVSSTQSHLSMSSSASSSSSEQSQYLGQRRPSNPITAANQRRYAEFLAGQFGLNVEMVQPAG